MICECSGEVIAIGLIFKKWVIVGMPLRKKMRKTRKTRINKKRGGSQTTNNKFTISVGILTYFAPKTLRHTLEMYKITGFIDIIDDLFVIIQKSDRQEQEQRVCEEFNIRYVLMPENGNIAWGFKAIYDNARNDILLFLENDFIIDKNTPKHVIEEFLVNSLDFLLKNKCDIVRGRSRTNPGEPNHAFRTLKNKPPAILIDIPLLSESIYWNENPNKTYPSKISRIEPLKGDDSWYIASSKSCNYTNNPYICKRDFFKKSIYPHLKFGENIEDTFSSIWTQHNHRCVFGPGIFTHYRSYDGHH